MAGRYSVHLECIRDHFTPTKMAKTNNPTILNIMDYVEQLNSQALVIGALSAYGPATLENVQQFFSNVKHARIIRPGNSS